MLVYVVFIPIASPALPPRLGWSKLVSSSPFPVILWASGPYFVEYTGTACINRGRISSGRRLFWGRIRSGAGCLGVCRGAGARILRASFPSFLPLFLPSFSGPNGYKKKGGPYLVPSSGCGVLWRRLNVVFQLLDLLPVVAKIVTSAAV